MADTKGSHNRSNMRYKPQTPIHAVIDVESTKLEFSPTIPALVFDESFKGCGLVVLETTLLQVGDRIRVQIGKLPIFNAEVRWRQEIADDILKVGILFLE